MTKASFIVPHTMLVWIVLFVVLSRLRDGFCCKIPASFFRIPKKIFAIPNSRQNEIPTERYPAIPVFRNPITPNPTNLQFET